MYFMYFMNYMNSMNYFIIKSMKLLLIFTIVIIVMIVLSEKFKNRIYDLVASIMLLLFGYLYIRLNISRMGSVIMGYIISAFIPTATIMILGILKLKIVDYCSIFLILIVVDNISIMYDMGVYLDLSIIFITLFFVSKIRYKSLKGNIMNVWLSFAVTAINSYIFDIIYTKYIAKLYNEFINEVSVSSMEKLLIFIFIAILCIVFNAIFIYFLKKYYYKYFIRINELGMKYAEIEKYFMIASVIIIVVITCIQFTYTWVRFSTYDYNNIIMENIPGFFTIFTVVIQIFYLNMMYKLAVLKENLEEQEREKHDLILYSNSLGKNMDSIRSIKHDIKNMFFTMGEFVERSNDNEMKEFFNEKIYPFANDEIKKNDLMSRLLGINNEQLKSFLYFKISQIMERGINIDLEINCLNQYFVFKIEFSDLIRILGIFIDNAIEECMNIDNSSILIKISQNNEMSSYLIQNSVRKTTIENGVKKGISKKGEGRGNGLIIVDNILKKYNNIILNSIIKDSIFMQNLTIHFR